MDGNPHADEAAKVINYYEHRNVDSDADVIALGMMNAQLAVAFELRTANILAAQATPEWLNEARARMGADPFPPAPPEPEARGPRDKRCPKMVDLGHGDVRCWLNAGHDGMCS